MPQRQVHAPNYVPGLDGLRAIAVLSVFLAHMYEETFANAIGVDMFFALSGFLITRNLLTELNSTGSISLPTFYVRRLFRLAPALMLIVVVSSVAACAFQLLYGHYLSSQLLASVYALTYTMNWVRAYADVLGPYSQTGWLGHTWSLSVEEQFYIVWPALLLVVSRFTTQNTVTFLTILLALSSLTLRLVLQHAGFSTERIYNGFDTRADGLLIGCTIALVRTDHIADWAARLWLIPTVALVYIFYAIHWDQLYTLSSTAGSICTAWLIIIFLNHRGHLGLMILETPPMRYIGRLSYGLYLWHFPVMLILLSLGFERASPMLLAISALATLSGAALSFHFVEQPALRFRTYFTGYYLARRDARSEQPSRVRSGQS